MPRIKTPAFNLEGLEDCRLFEWNKELWFTCTTVDTNPCGRHQISLCKLSNKASDEQIAVEKLLPMQGPDCYRVEKNWLPFVKSGQLYLIYQYAPFTIYKPHLETGECQVVFEYESSYDFSRFRGSAPPIEFDDGYLLLVHEVGFLQDFHRFYTHRFLFLDKEFVVRRLSNPFTFK